MSRRVSTGAALFFVLLAASLACAVLVVRARTPDLVLEVIKPPASPPAQFYPPGGPAPHRVRIEFFVRESDPGALVAIVGSHEQIVRTLDPRVALSERRPVGYTWDGRTDAGALAAPGRYRLRVDLPSHDREMIWPRRITFGNPPAGPPPTAGSVG